MAQRARDREERERILLESLNFEEKTIDSRDFAARHSWSHDHVVGVMNSLTSVGFVQHTQTEEKKFQLTPEGFRVVEHGSPEALLFQAIPSEGIEIAQIPNAMPSLNAADLKRAKGNCFKRKWLRKDGDLLVKAVNEISDETKLLLDQFQVGGTDSFGDESKKIMKELKGRKLLKFVTVKTFNIEKGPKYSPIPPQREHGEVTLEHIINGSWKTNKYKPLNVNTLGPRAQVGCLHPLLKVRTEFRHILLEMGFEEMQTNNFVESSFWNFDSLFQPQQHPARDAHDTFFLTTPASGVLTLPEYTERVREMHEHGDGESIGWRYEWSYDEARKNLLRTHTTAVSSRMLYQLGQQEKFEPKKYFSIDRVFRNETVDATHLAEFHQVEGFIADYNLTLGDLIGIIAKFFEKIGITNVKFKPAYNPYTEPSMEIFGFSPQNGWMEVGNSGIFRPEMLRPMNLPDNVNVIAWGLSLERPTMIKYGIDNIRKLFGPEVELNVVRKNPIARFD